MTLIAGALLTRQAAAADAEVEEAWVARYDGPGWQSGSARAIAVDPDGNTVVAGQIENPSSGTSTISTLKYDREGRTLWEAGLDEGQQSWPAALETDSAGAVYVAGAVAENNQPQNLLLVKYGAGGEKLWSLRYRPDQRSSWSQAVGMVVDGRGNVHVAGILGGDTGADYLTAKYDSDGNECWRARYDGGVPGDDQPTALAVDAEENVYVTGVSTLGDRQGFLTVKYDPDGHEVWFTRYDGDGPDEVVGRPGAIAVDRDGSVYVTGQSGGGPRVWWSVPWDYLTVKYDSDGNEVWIARYDGPDELSDDVTGLAIDADGSVIVTGTSYGRDSWSFATVKYDAEGSEAWIARHGVVFGGGGASASSLVVDPFGCVYVSGWADGPAGSDCLSVKYDSDGNEVWIARYGQDGRGEASVAAALDADRGLHIAGSSSDNFGTSFLTLKYDADGNEVWIGRHQSASGGSDRAVALAVDVDGNVYAAGTTTSQNRPGGDFATVSYDPRGAERWTARYDHQDRDSADTASGMAIDGEGNVHVTGSSRTPDANSADFVTVKYDREGRLLWARTFAEPYHDQAAAIAVDPTGGVIVTGSSRSESLSGTEDFVTLKYDANGEEVWVARYDGPHGRGDTPVAVAIDADGSVVVTGSSRSGGTSTSSDYLTVKHDALGGILWAATFAGPAGRADTPAAVAVDRRGDVYVTGTSTTSASADFLTVKYDAGGGEVWVRRYDAPSLQNDTAVALGVAHDGGVYVTGTVGGGGRRRDIATLRYSAGGAELWVAIYSGPADQSDTVSALAVDPRGGVAITGASRSSSSAASADYLTVKYDANGRERWVRLFDGDGGADEAASVVIGAPGSVYVVGSARRTGATDQDFVTVGYVETITGPVFLRGDCDGDGRVGGAISDALVLLSYNFARGRTPPCLAACDANGDGEVHGQVADAVYLLSYSFAGGPAPAPPFPECAPGDLAGDETLGCEIELEDCD